MSYSVNIKGLTELQAKFDKLPAELKAEANSALQSGAELFVRNAQRDAAVDFGRLKQGITHTPVVNLSVTMVSAQDYSAYVEWGTITHVSVPAEYAEYAIQFKGRGVRKTGGMYPRPFFFKQIPLAVARIEERIQAMIKGMQI